MKIWNTFVVHVVWNRPPKSPIPLFNNEKSKLVYPTKIEKIQIVIVILEYKMDLSRLKVIAFDNNNNNKEFTST